MGRTMGTQSGNRTASKRIQVTQCSCFGSVWRRSTFLHMSQLQLGMIGSSIRGNYLAHVSCASPTQSAITTADSNAEDEAQRRAVWEPPPVFLPELRAQRRTVLKSRSRR
mmetsp:Transcript_19205/g.57885  ORF Transcript_19205/g.57885 Transcript_19205/m.57885 type:complete len:110 (+) Transcript_19205:112-441(+)